MLYKVRITPIIPTFEIWEGPFFTEDEAWEWVKENNCPYVDYDVVPVKQDSEQRDNDQPPWD